MGYNVASQTNRQKWLTAGPCSEKKNTKGPLKMNEWILLFPTLDSGGQLYVLLFHLSCYKYYSYVLVQESCLYVS